MYPLFREKEATYNSEYEKLSRFLFRHYGLFPTSGDGHLGEFFPYAHEFIAADGYDFEKYEKRRQNIASILDGIVSGTVPIDDKLVSPSGEKAFTIIKGIMYNTNELLESVNIPNDGYISNLPADAIVEVPAVISGNGVIGLALGELPRGIASLCRTQVDVQHLVVDAGVQGDRGLGYSGIAYRPEYSKCECRVKNI